METELYAPFSLLKIQIHPFVFKLFFSVLKFNAIYQLNFIWDQVAVNCPLDFLIMCFHQNQQPAESNNCCGASACVFKAVIFILKLNILNNTYI